MEELVSQTGTIIGNRVRYVILDKFSSKKLGFLNVYASNNTTQQMQLWRKLITSLPTDCNWILIGDFDFVESRCDKTNACNMLIPMAEKLVFQACKAFLLIEESNCSVSNLKFFWNNYRSHGSRILACLDRFYCFRPSVIATRRITIYRI